MKIEHMTLAGEIAIAVALLVEIASIFPGVSPKGLTAQPLAGHMAEPTEKAGTAAGHNVTTLSESGPWSKQRPLNSDQTFSSLTTIQNVEDIYAASVVGWGPIGAPISDGYVDVLNPGGILGPPDNVGAILIHEACPEGLTADLWLFVTVDFEHLIEMDGTPSGGYLSMLVKKDSGPRSTIMIEVSEDGETWDEVASSFITTESSDWHLVEDAYTGPVRYARVKTRRDTFNCFWPVNITWQVDFVQARGTATSVIGSVKQGSDDAGPDATSCSYSVAHNEIYFGRCDDGNSIISGFRFQNVRISPGTIIDEAHLEFTVDGPYNNEVAVEFRGHLVPNSATFSDTDAPSDRAPLTSAAVLWTIPASDVWSVGESWSSPDLTAIVQEIVNLGGWESGNPLTIIVQTNPAMTDSAHRRVFAWEREGNGAHAARLVVTWTLSPLALTSPTGGERWQVEEEHDITWTSHGISNVKLEYSVNGGIAWNEIEPSLPASTGSYTWVIPNLTSNQCKVRVSDVADPSVFVESDAFTIKGWILTRLVDGTYEEFQLDKHAWRFGNSEKAMFDCFPGGLHEDFIMWPDCWWRQFDYTQPPYPLGWPFPPVNAKRENFPDWPLFVETFGEDNCYYDPPPGLVIYRPSAVEAWVGLKNGLLKGSWGGSCYGFAVSSFAAFDDKERFLEKFPGVGDFDNLRDLTLNNDRRRAINQLMIHQFGLVQLLHSAIGYFKDPITTLNELKEMFLSDTRRDSYISIRAPGTSSAHAINPYKIVRDENDPNIWHILVYDNNAPNDTERKIWVMEVMGIWMWAYPPLGWIGDKGMHLTGPAIDYLEQPIFPELPINSLLSVERATAGDAPVSNELIDSDHLLLYNTSAASIIITDPAGRTIGYDDSVTFNEFDNGIPIIPTTSAFQPPIGYFVPEAGYTIQMQNFDDSLSYLSVFNNSSIYSYYRSNALSTQMDNLSYGDGLGMRNQNDQTKDIWLQNILVEADHEKIFQVENCELAQGDSMHFDAVDRRDFYMLNLGSAKDYDLRVKLVSAAGAFIFEHPDIESSSNTSHTISPDWQDFDNQSVQVFIDHDLDGTSDDTLTIENYSKAFNFQQAGWYMISLPLAPPDSLVSSLFPSALGGIAFTWNAGTGYYETVDELEPKKGYWLAIPEATIHTIAGVPVEIYTLTLPTPGWYMIGSISHIVDFTDPQDDPDGAIAGTFGWDAETQSYYSALTLERGKGYWIAVVQACELMVGDELVSSAAKATQGMSWQEFASRFGEQPPAPPQAVFSEHSSVNSPDDYGLSQNYPNPFNPETVIEYQLPEVSHVSLKMFTILGQEVRTLVDGEKPAGYHRVIWDGRTDEGMRVESGVYFVRMQAGEFEQTRKVVLLK